MPLYVPTPPPVLAAADHDDVCQNQVSRFPLSTEETSHPPPKIECCFSSYNNEYFLNWTGPDLLSPSSCTDDVFLYLSAFYPREKLDWADIRLYVLSNATEEVVATYPFFLPRTESILGNLSQVRQLVHDSIVSHDVENLHFRLIVRPRSQEAPGSMGTKKTFSSYFRPVVPISPLDPYFFVQNIAGNY
ncbi:hypothetical protein N7522_001779 [Penicillium canescens]|nr:hypothetical protein N7522_001779 [Penicillium canescens]